MCVCVRVELYRLCGAGKARRDTWSMLGGEVLKKQVEEGVSIRRVGFVTTGAPSRQHCKLTTLDGKEVTNLSINPFSKPLLPTTSANPFSKPLVRTPLSKPLLPTP